MTKRTKEELMQKAIEMASTSKREMSMGFKVLKAIPDELLEEMTDMRNDVVVKEAYDELVLEKQADTAALWILGILGVTGLGLMAATPLMSFVDRRKAAKKRAAAEEEEWLAENSRDLHAILGDEDDEY